MCGIAGAVWLDPADAIDESTLKSMTATLTHRGPDDGQTYFNPSHIDGEGRSIGVGLGFRRLSIIDVEGSRQPMANETEDIHMVFNGEIYNYQSLQKRLQAAGHRFLTDGDGETILHGYEDHHAEVFSQLVGMFAVAIWDGRRHQLVLARDRIGQKPLYYAVQRSRIVFASELKALAKIPGVCETIDPAAIDEFLTYQYIPHPGTIWKGVYKLPPGHMAVFKNGKLDVTRYWNPDFRIQRSISHADAVEQVRESLIESVRIRLRSDVPLGTFLSGGIDSSIITAVASKESAEPVRTFSIGFPESDFDETRYAAKVAEHLKTRHTRFEVTPDDISILDDLVYHYDEPFGDSSALPTWYLCRETRREVTVALSGDGGDELFAGYERYRALWLSQRIQRLLMNGRFPGSSLIRLLPDSNRQRSLVRRAKRFIEALGESPPRRYLQWLQIFPETMRASLYRDEFVERLPGTDPAEFIDSLWEATKGRDLVTRASLTDVRSYLPLDLCVKVDIASMANSLEVRQPMLDHRLVELAASLPVEHKFRGRRGKLILQDAFGDLIPEEIFTRPKMGFGIPIGSWFRNAWNDPTKKWLLGDDARILEYFRPEAIESLIGQHDSSAHNHGYRLWNLVILEKWMRRWT
ncbi:MAG: asparagine synthase (glutamine-hydrolyzing) [Planctomycetota bacterium]